MFDNFNSRNQVKVFVSKPVKNAENVIHWKAIMRRFIKKALPLLNCKTSHFGSIKCM